MAAISIRITTTTYVDANAACLSGPGDIGGNNLTLWYNDTDGSLSTIPVGGLQLYLNESAANTNDGSTDIWSGTSTYYYCDTEDTSLVDCAIEVIDTGKIGAVTYCSPSVIDGTETVTTGGSIDINIHDLISDNIDADEDLTVTFSTPTLGTLGTYDSALGEVQYTAGSTAGIETIDFTAEDLKGNVSSTGQIAITITQANTAPTTQTANLTVASESITTINLNDYIEDSEDADGDLVLTLTQTVDAGSLDFIVNNTITDNEIVFTAPEVESGNPDETTQFQYSVEDTGGSTATGIVNLTITAAANTAPVANNSQTLTVNSEGTLSTDLSLLVTDNEEENSQLLTYTIETDPPSGEGSVSIVNGYVGQYQAPQVDFGESAVTTSYSYRVTDNGGLYDIGVINIQVNPAANTAPIVTIDNTPPDVEFNSGANDFSFTCDDNEQSGPLAVTVSAQGNKGSVAIVSTSVDSNGITECLYTYTPNAGEVGEDSFTLQVSDGQGGITTETVTIKIKSPAYISFGATIYKSDEDSACLEEITGTVWVATANQFYSVEDLGPGATLLQTSGGQPYRPETNAFIKLEDFDGTIRYFEVDPSGNIASTPQLCGVQSGLGVSSNVYYTASESLMCDEAADIVTVWYSVNLAQAGSILATLIGNNVPLFTSEYYANLYANGLNSELEGLIPSGLYAENTVYNDPNAIYSYFKRSVDNIWVNSPETGSIIWKCAATVVYDSYSISSVDIPINNATSVHNLCEGSTSSTTIWYAVAQDGNGLSEGKSLLEIIQQNIPIYMSQEGLEGEIISDMWPTGAFSVNGEYGVWTNDALPIYK
jgi:hypothetical protein